MYVKVSFLKVASKKVLNCRINNSSVRGRDRVWIANERILFSCDSSQEGRAMTLALLADHKLYAFQEFPQHLTSFCIYCQCSM
ncbi:hypothetical protein NC653_037159 [Populus alba x Populus x berolinensis]|uniref:Uncharacterized protein n=1 Tax=Populus alba x Populus x berolinensis TaxID=444605 RepID=A0AAD6LN16_9ROSI|nr:hypothetical protein NC653_037159 [Populus alba x Populus x berolinensis]